MNRMPALILMALLSCGETESDDTVDVKLRDEPYTLAYTASISPDSHVLLNRGMLFDGDNVIFIQPSGGGFTSLYSGKITKQEAFSFQASVSSQTITGKFARSQSPPLLYRDEKFVLYSLELRYGASTTITVYQGGLFSNEGF